MKNKNILSVVEELSSLNLLIDGQPYEEAIKTLEDKIYDNKFSVAVVGDFSTGKSTFINALLGEELLYHATKEATGIITTVQYDERAYAQCTKDGRTIEELDLTGSEGRKKLNKYLDIENKGEADNVNIFYPIEGMEKDIVFFDTPGIEKMSEEQILMTKYVIARANAIIFLINKSGFTEQALKVISGEHDLIGKISSSDMIVVITHIGEIYDNRENTEPHKQIERIIGEAKENLLKKSLDGINVFAVDSQDYLWGSNDSVYNRELENRNIILNGEMLSQKEYIDRSGFDEFKTFLYGFLERDNRSKSKEKDIENTAILILDAIEQDIKEQGNRQESYDDKLRVQVEKQIEDACKNQRLFYNRLIGQIQTHIDTYLGNVEYDVSNIKKTNQEIVEYIDRSFITLEDINEEKLNDCISKTTDDIDRLAIDFQSKTNEHVSITQNNFVKSIFSKEFQKIFDTSVNIKLVIPQSDFTVVLKKDDYDAGQVIEDSDLRDLENERKEIMTGIKALDDQILNYRGNKTKEHENEYRTEKDKLDNWYENEIRKLGTRPKARQKYREVTKSKGILFWKKTWTDIVPDGMDSSEGEAWDKKQRLIMKEYDEKLAGLDSINDKMEETQRRAKKLESLLAEEKSKLKHINERIRLQKEFIENGKTKYTEAYISEKKEAVASCCEHIRTTMLDQLVEEIGQYLYESKKKIEKNVKQEMALQIESYKKNLIEKNKSLCERVKVSAETKANSLKRIKNLREMITNG